MSKKKTKNRKKSKKSGKSKSNQQQHLLARKHSRLQRDLPKIYYFLDQEEWDEARELLEDLHRRYPKNPMVLSELVNLAYDTDDMRAYLYYVRKYAPLVPEDGDMTLGLSGGYMANAYPFAGYYYRQEYLRKFPDHERAAEVRESIPKEEELLDSLLPKIGVGGEEGYERGYQHDIFRAEMDMGDRATALQMGAKLLEKYPLFVSVYNNLSQLEFQEGNSEKAIQYARRALEIEADNFHASANLAKYLYILGHVEEANAQAQHLGSLQHDMAEFWLKRAEAFSYLGHFERVEAVVREIEEDATRSELPGMGLLYHLGGVAALRLGDEKLARTRWRRIQRGEPAYNIARVNLEDLKQPKIERHGPIPFSQEQWLPANFLTDLKEIVIRHEKGKGSSKDKDARLAQEFRTYFDDHPRLMHNFGSLLEHGGDEGRETVFRVADISEHPLLFERIRAYASGQQGPDKSRLEAIELLNRYKYLSIGTIPMWFDGEWAEIFVCGFEIGEESEVPFSITNHEAKAAYMESFELLREGNASEAEVLLKRANQLQPEHPIILNNLSLCYEQMDELDKAADVRREVFQKNPDYLFGQTSFANQAVQDGDLEQAQEILNPLLRRKKLHFSEFSAVADSQLRILIERGELEEAKFWIRMWRDVSTTDPQLALWEERMEYVEAKNTNLAFGALKKLIGKS